MWVDMVNITADEGYCIILWGRKDNSKWQMFEVAILKKDEVHIFGLDKLFRQQSNHKNTLPYFFWVSSYEKITDLLGFFCDEI